MIKKIALLACVASLLIINSGCVSTRTVVVQPGDPVQIRKDLRKVPIWVPDENGNRIESTVDIPAGWWALPDVFVEGEQK